MTLTKVQNVSAPRGWESVLFIILFISLIYGNIIFILFALMTESVIPVSSVNPSSLSHISI